MGRNVEKNHDVVTKVLSSPLSSESINDNHMGTSGDFASFGKIISSVFTILSYYVTYPVEILSTNERPALLRCYDINGFVALFYLSRRLGFLNKNSSC